MVEKLSSFLNWLTLLMDEKDVTPADIARTGYVTDSAISLLFSGKTKSVSFDMCRAIAKATDTSLIIIYRMAGLLPPLNATQLELEEIAEEAGQLNPQDRMEALAFIRMKRNLRKRNG